MGKKNKKQKKQDQVVLLTEQERRALVMNVKLQLASLKDPSPRVLWTDMDSIKKLYVMLDLFAQYGKEFETSLPLPQLEDRYIEVKLRCIKKLPSTVVIRSGMYVEEDL